jgi:hypothetical protein
LESLESQIGKRGLQGQSSSALSTSSARQKWSTIASGTALLDPSHLRVRNAALGHPRRLARAATRTAGSASAPPVVPVGTHGRAYRRVSACPARRAARIRACASRLTPASVRQVPAAIGSASGAPGNKGGEGCATLPSCSSPALLPGCSAIGAQDRAKATTFEPSADPDVIRLQGDDVSRRRLARASVAGRLAARQQHVPERVQGTFRDRVLIQTRYSVAKPTDSRSRESVSKPPAPPRGAALRPDSRTLAVGTSYSTYTLRCSGCSVGVTMTAGHFNDPEQWRQQADEARAIARQLPNPESKAVMMRIAAYYYRAGRGLGPRR